MITGARLNRRACNGDKTMKEIYTDNQDGRNLTVIFNNLQEVADAEPLPRNKKLCDEYLANRRDVFDWFGLSKFYRDGKTSKVSAMINKLCDGIPSFLTAAKEIMANESRTIKGISAKVEKRRRQIKRSYAGDEIDMQRVYAGRLDSAWRKCTNKPKNEKQHTRHVSIVYNGDFNGSVDGRDILKGELAFCLALDVLIRSGYSVEVFVVWPGKKLFKDDEGLKTCFAFRAKAFNDRLNLLKLLNACSPACFRTLGFKAHTLARHKQVKDYEIRSSFGSSLPQLTDTMLNNLNPDSRAKVIEFRLSEYSMEYMSDADVLKKTWDELKKACDTDERFSRCFVRSD